MNRPIQIEAWTEILVLLLAAAWSGAAAADGGLSTDGTVGPKQTLSGSQADIPQSLGTTVGKNVFHSFSQFNVDKGQTVTFQENAPNTLDNVISRVTGGNRSDINGTLRSTPGGHANLYLINPNGVVFGPNAKLDVPGDFHASTADE
jgi:filamentous hemagglutinin family protein